MSSSFAKSLVAMSVAADDYKWEWALESCGQYCRLEWNDLMAVFANHDGMGHRWFVDEYQYGANSPTLHFR